MGEVIEWRVDVQSKNTRKQFQAMLQQYRPFAIVTFVLPMNWNQEVINSSLPCYMCGGIRPDDAPIATSGYRQIDATSFALGKLKEKGHSRILYPIHPKQITVAQLIREAYKLVFPEMSDDAVRAYTPMIKEDYGDSWQRFLQTYYYAVNPTAIILSEVIHLISVYSFCGKNGIRIPNDLSIVCEDGAVETEWFSPVPARMAYPFERQNRHFARWVKSGCKWQNRTIFTLDWYDGESIAEV